jgi:hypothetical protein
MNSYDIDLKNEFSNFVFRSRIILKLNKVSRGFEWKYATDYSFMQYKLKLYGCSFNLNKIVEIDFNVSNYKTNVSIYKELKTIEGTERIPCELSFFEMQMINNFIHEICKHYNIASKKKDKGYSPGVIEAMSLYGKEIVKVIR